MAEVPREVGLLVELVAEVRYLVLEIRGADLHAEHEVGDVEQAQVGEFYAECDDNELAYHIVEWLNERNVGADPVQFAIWDTLAEGGPGLIVPVRK